MRKMITRAFTLVEVLASVLILGGVIVTIVKYSADGLATSLQIERGVKSTMLAEREMEKIKNVLRKSFDTDFTTWPNALGDNYLADRNVTDVSSTLKVVEVSVGYDVDSNGTLSADEIMITVTTQNAERS